MSEKIEPVDATPATPDAHPASENKPEAEGAGGVLDADMAAGIDAGAGQTGQPVLATVERTSIGGHSPPPLVGDESGGGTGGSTGGSGSGGGTGGKVTHRPGGGGHSGGPLVGS